MPPTSSKLLDREEYIEQAYFFRVLRERAGENVATQEVLMQIHEEILSTTRLPLAIQFLATEIKHTGLLSSGFAKLPHYFTPYQAFLVQQTEHENLRFSLEASLLVLQREAEYRSKQPTPAGMFVFQFEVLCRNRLGYDEGLAAMVCDPLYDDNWRELLDIIRRRIGTMEFADFIFLRSVWYILDQRRDNPDYQPPREPLFDEKEGKIAKANRGRDPLYLFAALQRQLGYPEVPRPRPQDDLAAKVLTLQARLRDLETRLKLVESEVRGQLDLNQFTVKPDSFPKDD